MLVERKASGRLGSNPAAPLVVSRRSSQEKMPWRDVASLEGNVEKEFLHPVLLGESILPYRQFNSFEGVAQLSSQFPIAPLRVVYAKAGSLPAAMVLRDERAVIDHMLYWTAPASEEEAHYLAAILNSETARSRAEQYQARGQFGARHFDKVMFNLPIPRFDVKNKLHRAISDAGVRAEDAAKQIELIEGEKFQRARKRVRDNLAELGISAEIDKLVEKLLDGAAAD